MTTINTLHDRPLNDRKNLACVYITGLAFQEWVVFNIMVDPDLREIFMLDFDDRVIDEIAAPAAAVVIALGASVVRVVVGVVTKAPSRVGTK